MSEEYAERLARGEAVHGIGPGDFATGSGKWWHYKEGKQCKHPSCDKVIMDKATTCGKHRNWWKRTRPRIAAMMDRFCEELKEFREGNDTILKRKVWVE